MTIRFDEKGKFFTDVISKESVPVKIRTQTHLIQGNIYIRPNERIIDALNKEKDFIAVTNAVVFDPLADKPIKTNFLCLQRAHIIWIIPTNELIEDDLQPGENKG